MAILKMAKKMLKFEALCTENYKLSLEAMDGILSSEVV